jgi:5'(3')-deoxyribonucleotidase
MKLQEVTLQQNPKEVSYVIFCDMDGVLTDLKGTATRELPKVGFDISQYSEDEYFTNAKFRTMFWEAVKRYQDKYGYVFWRYLQPKSDAMELWNYIKDRNAQILTATGNAKYHSTEQKQAWVTEYLGSHVRVNCVGAAPLKSEYAAPNHILIDDQMRAIEPFVNRGGKGIHHKSAAHTIEQLKLLGA